MHLDLYIENQKAELFKDEPITLTDTMQNVKDISKVFSPYTQTFSLPASDINNTIFKHYYNSQITNGFDARFRVPAILKLNGADFKTGEIRLNGVQMRNNAVYSYKVGFFSDVVKMKDLFGQDDLSALNPLSAYDTRYGSAYLNRLFETGETTSGVAATGIADRNVTLPLICLQTFWNYDSTSTITTPNLFDTPFYIPMFAPYYGLSGELKPALKVKRIIEAIETQYDIEFNMSDEVIGGETIVSFFDSDVFDELYLWLHRENAPTNTEGDDAPKYGIRFNWYSIKWYLSVYTYVAGGDGDFFSGGDEFTLLKGESMTLKVTLDATAYTGYLFNSEIRDELTNEIIWQQFDVKIPAGATTLTATNMTSGTLESRTFKLRLRTEGEAGYNWAAAPALGLQAIKTLADGTILSSTYTRGALVQTDNIYIQDYIPKIKVIDFLSNLMKVFNLTAYTLKGSSKIYIQTLDDFMSIGAQWNLSEYINIEKTSINRPIPFSAVNFNYSNAVTQPSIRYLANYSAQYGNLKYSAPDKFDGKAFDLQVKTQREVLINVVDETRTPTGNVQAWWVDAKGEVAKGSGYLFFNVNVDSSSYPITINSYNQYNAPSNSTASGNHTLNFGNEFDVYTRLANTNSLFARFYTQYIVQNFQERTRIKKFESYLPLNFLLNYKLNDKIIIGTEEYFINSVKTNLLTRKTTLELITKFEDYEPSVLS
tara:strand:+ start:7173 stop:9302 length:2130 start_codon:yes stop_codon:yes gene_type:complete